MTAHLSVDDLASHLDGVLPSAEQVRVERHLVECDACRAELVALSQVLRTRPARRRWMIPVGLAAAAALALLIIWPHSDVPTLRNYREPAVSTTVAPLGIAPHGPSAAPLSLVWTHVPHAQRYRLTIFDSTGAVLWESQSLDTSLVVPKSVKLRARITYFWQVEAQTGFDRWIRSDVIPFAIIRP